jgi:hypothetical protein
MTLKGYAYERVSVSELVAETNRYYSWGMVDAASHSHYDSNLRNQFNVSMEYGWNKNLEGEVTYEDIYMIIRVLGCKHRKR